MAYWINSVSKPGHNAMNYREFCCDSIDDIKELPNYKIRGTPQEIDGLLDTISCRQCSLGSECIVLDEGGNTRVFKLGSDLTRGINGWIEM